MSRKWSAFSAGSAIASADQLVGLQSGVNVRWTFTQLGTYLALNTLAGGTITTSQPMTLTQTWNAGGVTFTAFNVTVTDTASASGSSLIDIGVSGSTARFTVAKNGDVTSTSALGGGAFARIGGDDFQYFNSSGSRLGMFGNNSAGMRLSSAQIVAWSSSSTEAFSPLDTGFARNGAGVAEVNNGSAATFRDLKLREVLAQSGVATPAAASAVASIVMGSALVGIYWGTGDPNAALTAPQGSLFIRTDGSGVANRMYINTNASTAWASFATSG